MKKAILILFIFLFQTHSILQAQLFDFNDQVDQFVEITQIQSLGDGGWLLAGNSNSIDSNKIYLKIVDTIGETSHTTDTVLLIQSIEKIVGRDQFRGFALITQNNKKFLIRLIFDSDGITIGNSVQISDSDIINNIKMLANGNVITVGYKIFGNQLRSLVRIYGGYFINLNTVYVDYYTPGYFSDVIVFPDSSFTLTGGMGENQIFGARKYNKYYDQQGDFLEGIESDRVFQLGNNGYLLIKDHIFTKLDNDFQIENYVDFSNYGSPIDIAVDDENIFLLYQEEEEPPKILKINQSLLVEDFFAVEDERFIAKDLEVSESELGIGGYLIPSIPLNSTTNSCRSTSGFFKTFSKNGMSEEGKYDLEIVDVKIEDHEKKFICEPAAEADGFYLNLKNIKVTIVNKGESVVENAQLLVEVKGIENCIPGQIKPKHYTMKDDLALVHLEPGDTLKWRISAFEFFQNIQDSSEVEICTWLTTIENKRDIDEENNYFCGKVTLGEGYTEAPIVMPVDREFLIYPNPLDKIMKVSLLRASFDPTLIEFYDYLGRELGQKYFIAPRAQYKEIDISQLPSGIYYVQISNEIFEKIVRVYMN